MFAASARPAGSQATRLRRDRPVENHEGTERGGAATNSTQIATTPIQDGTQMGSWLSELEICAPPRIGEVGLGVGLVAAPPRSIRS